MNNSDTTPKTYLSDGVLSALCDIVVKERKKWSERYAIDLHAACELQPRSVGSSHVQIPSRDCSQVNEYFGFKYAVYLKWCSLFTAVLEERKYKDEEVEENRKKNEWKM